MPKFLSQEAGAAARAQAVREALRDALPAHLVRIGAVAPMLAETGAGPFDDPAFLFEPKLDGFRALVAREEGAAVVRYRSGAVATAAYPELAAALAAMPTDFIADGEIVVQDEQGRPAFQRLQKRALLTAPRDVARAARELPALLYLFDLLAFEGHDLRLLPLVRRKALLHKLLPAAGSLRGVAHVDGRGTELFASVRELGLEGMMAKRQLSPYRSGRSRDWLKVRVEHVSDLAVVGFTRPKGGRPGFGALHVAAVDCAGALVYVGRVGGGFDERELDWATAQLAAMTQRRAAGATLRGPVPRGPGHVWVDPRLVVEVRYKELTEEGLLRQPTFLRFRPDKAPRECALADVAAASTPVDRQPAAGSQEIRFDAGGEPLRALLLVPPKAHTLFVCAHGAGAGMEHPFLSGLAEALARQGVATLRYLFPYWQRGQKRPDPARVLEAVARRACEEAVRIGAERGLRVVAGGKSMGGRMTSQAAAQEPLPGVLGLLFVGFPLHPAGKPSQSRAAHLAQVTVPMLFLQGTRDALASLDLLRPMLPAKAVLHVVAGADHGFEVLRRSGRDQAAVLAELAVAVSNWAKSLR